ncbi:PIN domain protein [Candidatus Moduliflexus flocculans]|uniref:Ribonuclease VapC n=1 Tax=Candidatus Moduliflexus flocculans TaxID=1499966 RepID=A0A081BRR4_9BACT|nr:PIN domain protein [Candidatus Moduliflexus flocculans]
MERILVDTCILIAAYRGDETIIQELLKIKNRIVISPITAMELYRGAKTKERKKDLEKQLKSYAIVHLNKDIGEKAISLMKKHQTGRREVFIPDCIIGATCLLYDFKLFTENKSDFEFMEHIKFYDVMFG